MLRDDEYTRGSFLSSTKQQRTVVFIETLIKSISHFMDLFLSNILSIHRQKFVHRIKNSQANRVIRRFCTVKSKVWQRAEDFRL